jgi:hypothetical protein
MKIPAGRRAAAVTVIMGLALLGACRKGDEVQGVAAAEAVPAASSPAFLHARVTTVDGETYRGRLRFGGDEEAFWADYFNGVKAGNPWVEYVPRRELPGRGISVLGLRIGGRWAEADLGRPFMARMGDIAKLEAKGRDLWVTLRSGTVVHLDRWSADDYADGVRVWDETRGVVDLGERRIRTIEFLPGPRATSEPSHRLHGTVHTRHGQFSGFIQWARRGNVALDELQGYAPAGELVRLPFATIRSIARHSSESSRVTLLDGRELVLSGTRAVGEAGGGVYVDDERYGRVLVSWDAFDRVDITPVGAGAVGSGPSYDDFPTGRPLTGTVTTLAGERHAGRLVYDLDESETTETLDAPLHGVHYTIPFDLVGSIVLPGGGARTQGPATVTLRSGERLQLERSGDLGPDNAGLLIFVAGRERPEYVRWSDVARVDLDAAAGA